MDRLRPPAIRVIGSDADASRVGEMILRALAVTVLVGALVAPDPAAARVTAKKCAKQAYRVKHKRACKKLKRKPARARPAEPAPGPATIPPDPLDAVSETIGAVLDPQPPGVADPGRPFAASSFWNRRLDDAAPLDPASPALIADLQRQLQLGPPWINTNQYSTAVYTVPRDQPTVRVELDDAARVDPGLQVAWEQVPLPPDAKPAAGTDGTAVVWQPSTDTMWEFWRLARTAGGGWHAAYGGRMRDVSSNEGRFTAPRTWGASATGLPWIGGLMRLSEIRAGRFDHALALAIPEARAREFSWPAQRTDGQSTRPGVLPLGARLRLPADLDLDRLGLPPLVRAMAEAAQSHGIVIRDTAGSVAFYGEDAPGNLYYGSGGIFGGNLPDALLAAFPWNRLQVLEMDLRTSTYDSRHAAVPARAGAARRGGGRDRRR